MLRLLAFYFVTNMIFCNTKPPFKKIIGIILYLQVVQQEMCKITGLSILGEYYEEVVPNFKEFSYVEGMVLDA